MTTILELTSMPWRFLATVFEANLARRVEHDLAQQTTLSALDLRPTCRDGPHATIHGAHAFATTAPGPQPSSACASGSLLAPAGATLQPGGPKAYPGAGGTSDPATAAPPAGASAATAPRCKAAAVDITASVASSTGACTQSRHGTAAAASPPHTSPAGRGCHPGPTSLPPSRLSRPLVHLVSEGSAAGPSPDGVLSPVSPPSSRRSSSMSASAPSSTDSATPPPAVAAVPQPTSPTAAVTAAAVAAGLASRHQGGLETATSSSSSTTLPSTSTGTASTACTSGVGPDLAAGSHLAAAMAGIAGICTGAPSASTSTSTSIGTSGIQHPQFQIEASTRVHCTAVDRPAPTANPGPLQGPIASPATPVAGGVEAASGSGAASPIALALHPRRRRSATLRLRCIIRDPVTGSLLATAWGHVDDPNLPLRRPQGSSVASPVGSPSGRGSGGEAPGSLLLIEEQVLGRGAFGFVTLVSDAVTDRTYALKRLRRSRVSIKHVMQEQQALRMLVGGGGDNGSIAIEGAADEPLRALRHQHQQHPVAGTGGLCAGCGGVTGAAAAAVAAAGAAEAHDDKLAPPQQRPCRCRACMAAAAAAASGTQRSMSATAAAVPPAGGACMRQANGGVPTAGPARTAWLAKQQARGWLGVEQQPLPPSPQQRPSAVTVCRCRQRPAGSFCVRQLGTFQDEQYLYLLMEYCPGGDLDRLVRSLTRKTLVPRRSWLAQVVAGPAVAWRGLPESAARFYAAGIVLALQELHSLCIVYRDLKPGNVLIDAAGYPRLADFGMAKVLDGPAGRATSACGTLDYMAPEVVRLEMEQMNREREARGGAGTAATPAGRRPGGGLGRCPGDAGAPAGRSRPRRYRDEDAAGGLRRPREGNGQGSYGLGVDWWSFGAVLYVLLTGCKPFCPLEAEEAGEDPSHVLLRIVNPRYEVAMPLYLSPPARDLLRQLLVRQPRWRLGCGGGGAEEIRAHPFFEGFDWAAYEERRMPPPYPLTEFALPEDQEAASVACFFGLYGSSAAAGAGYLPRHLRNGAQQQQQGAPGNPNGLQTKNRPGSQAKHQQPQLVVDGPGGLMEPKRLRPQQARQQPPPEIMLQDF